MLLFMMNLRNDSYLRIGNELSYLRYKRIIRLENDCYGIGSQCYFANDLDQIDDELPRVAKGVYTSGENVQEQESAKKLLEYFGVREVGEDRATLKYS